MGIRVTVDADADEVESRTKDRTLALSSFKKVPDAPLGEVVLRKLKLPRPPREGRQIPITVENRRFHSSSFATRSLFQPLLVLPPILINDSTPVLFR